MSCKYECTYAAHEGSCGPPWNLQTSTAIQRLFVGPASLLGDWDLEARRLEQLIAAYILACLGYPRHRPEFAKIQPKQGLGSLEIPGFRAHVMHRPSTETTATRLSLQTLPPSLYGCHSSKALQSGMEYCF